MLFLCEILEKSLPVLLKYVLLDEAEEHDTTSVLCYNMLEEHTELRWFGLTPKLYISATSSMQMLTLKVAECIIQGKEMTILAIYHCQDCSSNVQILK